MSARRDIEGRYHRAIVAQLYDRLPGAVVHHSPNEFPGKGPMIARAIAKAKKNGMAVGFPDLVVFWRGQVALIEVKAPGGSLSDSQKALHPRLAENGFAVHVITDPNDTEAIEREMRQASSNWTPIGQAAASVVQENARQRSNAPGNDRQHNGENGDDQSY